MKLNCIRATALSGLLLCSAGCGDKSASIMAEVKKHTAAAVAVVDEASSQVAADVTGASASAALTVDEPYEDLGCFMYFSPTSSGSSILQVRSYDTDKGASETPAYLLHAVVNAGSLKDLSDQSIQASLFFKGRKGLLHTPPESPISVKVSSGIAMYTLEVSGKLINAKTGAETSLSGTLTGNPL